jgi:hypothetical protein
VNYQLLPKTEWNKISPIWAEYGSVPPVHDPYALMTVALDGERIVGCGGMQAVLHIEGLWVDQEYSGKVRFRELLKPAINVLPKGVDYYAFTPTAKTARLCEYVSMEKKNWGVYKGRT